MTWNVTIVTLGDLKGKNIPVKVSFLKHSLTEAQNFSDIIYGILAKTVHIFKEGKCCVIVYKHWLHLNLCWINSLWYEISVMFFVAFRKTLENMLWYFHIILFTNKVNAIFITCYHVTSDAMMGKMTHPGSWLTFMTAGLQMEEYRVNLSLKLLQSKEIYP